MDRPVLLVAIFVSCAILFSLFTVFCQVTTLSFKYLETSQVHRHVRVLEGKGGNPYQYRILSEYLVEAVILLLRKLGFHDPTTSGFVIFRVLQNFVIFLFATFYYKKLGLNPYVILIALSIIAWGMTQSLWDSDLVFNTYSDIIFYLAAGLVILYNRPGWIIPIVGIAALNRETSGLIPLMLILDTLYKKPEKSQWKKNIAISAGGLCLYLVIFFSLRYIFGEQPLVTAYGNHPGFEILKYNVLRYLTWVKLFGTLGLIPILALWSIYRWPSELRAVFWAIVPIWMLVHAFAAILAESRLMLVPFILVFVPGALFGVNNSHQTAVMQTD